MDGSMDIALGAAIISINNNDRFKAKKIYYQDGPS